MKNNTKWFFIIAISLFLVFFFLIYPNVSPSFNLNLAIGISLSSGLIVALLKILSEINYNPIKIFLRRNYGFLIRA